ncbi:hypothetical protein HY637_05000 [Candidatus Woesearchaeota archaeon]|nr:hypothetical protein [Candidatus Woesearchaeota archaeon]
MSAEKEIVNYWYNKQGLFTVNNIKTSNNRDCGILALKFDKDEVDEVVHVEVSCSITSNISETTNPNKSVGRIVEEKFENKDVQDAVGNYIRQFSASKHNLKKVLVLGAVPKSKKAGIIKKFGEKNVEVVEFDSILYDVLEKLDTQYYKNDVIRTLQLTRHLLLGDPVKLAKLIANDTFTSASRKEFLSNILDKGEILKEFKKTNVERLTAIMKNASLKPQELARMLEHDVLNRRTRKSFLDSLNEQEKIRRVVSKITKKRKSEMSLEKFI